MAHLGYSASAVIGETVNNNSGAINTITFIANFKAELATISMRPETDISLTVDQRDAMQKLLDALENLDDVQEVFTNAEL